MELIMQPGTTQSRITGLIIMLVVAAGVRAAEPLDVFLCAGQSNMAGAAVPEEMPPELMNKQEKILFFQAMNGFLCSRAGGSGRK
jgi:hypothetical protein